MSSRASSTRPRGRRRRLRSRHHRRRTSAVPFTLPDEYEEFRAAARRLADTGIAPARGRRGRAGGVPVGVVSRVPRFRARPLAVPRASRRRRRRHAHVRDPRRGDRPGVRCVVAVRADLTPRRHADRQVRDPTQLAQRTVPKVATGEWQASYCLSEPEAGSDVASMTTRAVRDGDHYVLNGRKSWITNAGVSDLYTVFAKTDPDAGSRGISAFVVLPRHARVLRREARAQDGHAGLSDG